MARKITFTTSHRQMKKRAKRVFSTQFVAFFALFAMIMMFSMMFETSMITSTVFDLFVNDNSDSVEIHYYGDDESYNDDIEPLHDSNSHYYDGNNDNHHDGGIDDDINDDDKDLNTSSVDQNKPKLNNLIFIATHMSDQHMQYFEYCWRDALKHSLLLNSSDITFYLTPGEEKENQSIAFLRDVFKDHKKKVSFYTDENVGLRFGATRAYRKADRWGWFLGYDWVFRMNPDVIIQNDSWFLSTMENDHNVTLMYSECFEGPEIDFGSNYDIPNQAIWIHTDFTAFKPNELPNNTLGSMYMKHAEGSMGRAMSSFVEKRQHRQIPGVARTRGLRCRLDGNKKKSPVVHYHQSIDPPNYECPATFW